MQLIKRLYKYFTPKAIRNKIWLYKDRHSEMGVLRKEVLKYYKELPKNDELLEVLKFVKDIGIATFPYPYIYNYNQNSVKVYKNIAIDLLYVVYEGKHLYYKRGLTELEIKENYNFLSIEQDKESPHRYLTDSYSVNDGDVVLDIGAAEGNFSLSIVEKVSQLYIFETDPEWIEALQATFAPWRDKVNLINKYVSNTIGGNNITIDAFFSEKAFVNFLKIDAEGAEETILEGAAKVLSQNEKLKVAITTYHKQNDNIVLADILKKYHFKIAYSKGFMFFLEDKQKPPYVRKGLIRATK